MVAELDTKTIFKTHFGCWRLLGMLPPQKWRPLYWVYSVLVTVLVTICYPLHLILGLFTSTSMYEVIQNVAITLTCLVCAMKTFAIWWRFERVDVIFDIVRRQDERMHSHEEVNYMKRSVYPPVRGIIILFYILCGSVGITSELSVLFYGLRGDWRLMYQAYFPFDPFASTFNYAVAHVYQFIGVSYIILQNLVNDTFSGAHLALLGGQVHLLGMRVARIGHDKKKTLAENYKDLLDCIHDHKDLLEYHRKLEDVISLYMFFQILFASMNMCAVLVFIVLFVQDPFTMAYYISYFCGMVAEILPSSYYGTLLECLCFVFVQLARSEFGI